MRDNEHVEEILARLMPAALREAPSAAIEETLDELAARDFPKVGKLNPPFRKWLWSGGLAALFALGAVFFSKNEPPLQPQVSQISAPDEIVLLHTSDRVEEMTDEGWREQQDGTAMHAMRVSLVGEKQVRDQKTGIVVRISQPREEWILIPINSF